MKITPVNQGNIHRRALEFLRGIQAAKSAAENYDAVLFFHSDRPRERNPVLPIIISPSMNFSITMLGQLVEVRGFSAHS